ncbi:GDSL esterase/lipase At1g29670-like [Apium graveolens]|uniref:GDSL esterase/lipase At1g29670-like n=1 Tax=Apium graveolens TaxID=4045 RepID=UPI003D78DFAE
MAFAAKTWLIGCIIALLFDLKLVSFVDGAPQVPCYFIFGDSLSDCGNNNKLQTLAKVNFLPYGIDYPGGISTGRFTNGKTAVDFLAEFLGFDHHMPAFTSVQGKEVLQGVNYASSGSGILNDTGKIVGERFSLLQQIDNHKSIIERIKQLQGNNDKTTDAYLGKCMYTVNIGSNDYEGNYLMSPAASQTTPPDKWAAQLVAAYSDALKILHDLGARKVAIWGLGSLGCEPSQIIEMKPNTTSGCVDDINHMVSLFDNSLPKLVDDLNKKIPDAHFVYVNMSNINPGNNPAALGVKVTKQPCCKVGDAGSCIPNSPPCANRNDYSYFDLYHPTEKAHLHGILKAYNSTKPQDVYPMNLSKLALL